jgi:hypothetical protein
LPYFGSGDYSDKEKLGRGRWSGPGAARFSSILAHLGRFFWRLRARFAIVLIILFLYILFWVTR